jgi:hypothetical protein
MNSSLYVSVALQEFHQPVEELVARYGEEDGWCLLGYLGKWASKCAISRRTRDISTFLDMMLA